MLFLASLRRAYKLSYTTYRPTKTFGYAIDSRLQARPYGSKSTSNSKFCKGKKSAKKAKRHVERWKRGKKLSRNASTLSPVALISDKGTSPTTVALIPVNLFEESQSDHDAFRDALAILALLKKKSRQVELFMESYNNLREGSALEEFMSESPYVTEGSEQEIDQLDKEILATDGKRVKEQPTLTEGNKQVLGDKHLDLKDTPVAGMQLNFEMNVTNIRDAILHPENLKQIRHRSFSDEEVSTLVSSTNVHVEPDNKATIPLQLNALIHGTVHIDPKKFSKEKLGQLKSSQFNEYVTAVVATLCSKALEKGFPMKISRNMSRTESLSNFERTDHKAYEPGTHVNKGRDTGTTFEVVDVGELFAVPQQLATAVDSSHRESVDRTEANNLIPRLDDLISAVKAGTHDQSADAVKKNVMTADDFDERAESNAESKDESVRAANTGIEVVETKAKEAEGNLQITGETREEIRGNVKATEEIMATAGRKVLPGDREWETAETEEPKAETGENTEAPEKTAGTHYTERIVERARMRAQAAAASEPSKEDTEGNLESAQENIELARKNLSGVAKTIEDPTEGTSEPALERRMNVPKVKATAEGGGDSEEGRRPALDAQASGAIARGMPLNADRTAQTASGSTETENAASRNSAPTDVIAEDRPLEAPPGEENKEITPEEANEMTPQTNVSSRKKADAFEKLQNSPEKLPKASHKVEGTYKRTAVPLANNADVLGKIIDALEIPDSKFQTVHVEKITSSSSSVQAEMDKSEIARQIEWSKGQNEDIGLSKYSNESFESSKSPHELYEVFSDADQIRSVETKNVNPRLDSDGYFPKEIEADPKKDEAKRLRRKYYQFKGELYNLNTFNGQPSSYAIGLGSAAAIPGKGKNGDRGISRDPHIVCVRKGSKGCTSPGLSENAFYVAKKTSPSDTRSKTSEISLRGLHQTSLDEVSGKRHAEKLGTRLCSTTSKSESDKKKGSVCGSTPPCQNKTKKQQLPPVKKKTSDTKCSDPCKRSSSTPEEVKCKGSASCSSKSNDPCQRSPSEQSKSEDSCKRSACNSKKESSSCSSNNSDPCKRSSSKSKDPCKTSSSGSMKSDPCKRSSSKSKDPCKTSSPSGSTKSDPCKRSSSESKDPCKTYSPSSSTKSDTCKSSSPKTKDPCQTSSSSGSKKSDPCKRSSSESKDPCKTSSPSSSTKSDPCKSSSSKTKDPCQRSSSSGSKKSDPCKRSSSKSKDPCKTSSPSSSTKSDPCKSSSSKSKDPCQRSSSSGSTKSDPCKRSSSKSKDPCKTSSPSSSTKSDPCKSSSSKTKDPCQRSSSSVSKKSDPCKRSSSKSKDPCKTSSPSSSTKADPCKRSSSKSNNPCKTSSSSNSNKLDPCKRSSSKSDDPCKVSPSSSSLKSDPCKKSSSKSSEDIKNQEAVILSPLKICRRTIPIKPVNENDVRVSIESVALSDSDIHMFETGAKKFPGITLGNEASGVVQKVGKKVKHLRAGDHVALECGVPCGRCSLCRSGYYNLCQKLTFKGCLKKYCTHPASFCHKISKSVPLPYAALGNQLSSGCNACAQAGIKPNSNVAIIGSCAMTLCTAMCANAMGCSNVCVICTTPDTHEIVTENITEKVECIDSQTTAKGIYQRICDSLRTHPDVVINCSCSTKTMNASIMALKPNGTCVVSGCLCECATYNMMDALMKEIRIIPSFRSKNMFPFAVHLLERGQIPIDCIIAECMEWKKLEAGFQKALTENNCGPRKVIVQCHAGNEGEGDARKS